MNTLTHILSANLVLVLLSTPVAAQIQSGFPENFNASADGVHIGETASDVDTDLRERFVDIETMSKPEGLQPAGTPLRTGYAYKELTLSVANGVTFPAALGASKQIESLGGGFSRNGAFQHDSFSVVYGSSITGSAVEVIRRLRHFDEPLDKVALLASIEETYGQAHTSEREDLTQYWAFKDAAAVPFDPAQRSPGTVFRSCLDIAALPRQILMINYERDGGPGIIFASDSNYFAPYQYRNSSPETVCDAAMSIEIELNRDGLAIGMTTMIVDILHMVEDQKAAIAEWAEPEPEAPQGATTVPKL